MAMKGFQNRKSPRGGVEDFPTPPWGTRALLTHVLPQDMSGKVCWEPSANRGFMVRPLQERFQHVWASDLVDYGVGFPVHNFIGGVAPAFDKPVDWIITNPPFNRAEEFVQCALEMAQDGVAVLLRSSWAEGRRRYKTLFSTNPPRLIAQFTERLPITAGGVSAKAVTMMPYAWFVWRPGGEDQGSTRFMWIPPCRKDLEREGDYE